jgi:hypothetical protein
MMLPKERAKISLLLFGVVLGLYGLFLLSPFRAPENDRPRYRKGMYAEAASSGALEEFAPWMIGIGGAALFGAYLLRER